MKDRGLMALVAVLVVIGVALMVIGFGSGGVGPVATPTKQPLSSLMQTQAAR